MQYQYSLGVDAGNISVMDYDYIIEHNGKYGETATRMCEQIKVPAGEYKVQIFIPHCWAGSVIKERIITTSGTIIIGDVCYVFSSEEVDHKVWLKFLNDTDYMKKANKHLFSVDTGGDGEFAVTITITAI